MKRIVLSLIVFFALFTIGYSAEVSMSAAKTSDAAIRTTGGGSYSGVIITTDGTNNCTVKVYDNASAASGNVLDDGTCAGASITCKGLYPWPIPYYLGVYADMTTEGTCTYYIFSK
jgi:hypothetical protein